MSDDRTGSGDRRNVLALPAAADPQRDFDRWAERPDPAPETAIAVTYSRTPDEWVRNALPAAEDGVERVLIRVGDPNRSARGTEGRGTELGPTGNVTIATVDDATDLDGLYESVRRYLGSVTGEGRDGRTVLTFESVDDLVEAVGLDEAIGILEEVTDLVARHGSDAYYLLDPTAHDPDVVGALCSLFDGIERVPSGAGAPNDDSTAGGPRPAANAGGVDPGVLHDVLRSGRRRRVLYALLSRPEGMEVRSLADRVAADDAADGRSETTDEVRTSLAHVDLPKMEGQGFVDCDADERIRATGKARTALPYLRLDAAADGVDLDPEPDAFGIRLGRDDDSGDGSAERNGTGG
jgi:hypothetical protein